MAIRPKNQAEQDLAAIEAQEATIVLAIRALIAAVNNTYWALWNLPDDQLIDALNALGPGEVNNQFARHLEKGSIINDLAESEGVADRVIIGSAREVAWNGTSFKVIYPPEPAEEIEQILPS